MSTQCPTISMSSSLSTCLLSHTVSQQWFALNGYLAMEEDESRKQIRVKNGCVAGGISVLCWAGSNVENSLCSHISDKQGIR